ncbi:Glycerophosphodiester phosphodiesterase GDPD1 [Forsythia ovata]|uniref:glycerophosphodiester phosphodiesterase n=1 Tax=Forsythia ovata TaxID=205694 RepID=A0ABD1XDL2_9LAMI
MALKSVPVSDVPNLDRISENATLSLSPRLFPKGGIDKGDGDGDKQNSLSFELPKKFVIMGHRGSGMNLLQSPDQKMKAIKENSVRSFNAAGKFNLDFIEFDVQVTRDGFPVIFHDIFILTQEKGVIVEKRVTDLSLDEFLSYGPQRETNKMGKPLFRKTKDGRIFEWKVEDDDHLCTLHEVFQKVDHSSGFNIEFKFDDNKVYTEQELLRVLEIVLQVVFENARDRPIIFSSFQPDAVQLMRKLQSTYPVYFLTNGGSEIYSDVRRNSLDEAIKLCLASGLQGIVSEVKAILRNPGAINKIKESKLSLITYGQLNNVPEVVYMQYLLGVEGVIVDLVKEITELVLDFRKPENEKFQEEGTMAENKTHFSQDELSFYLRLVPELVK